MAPRVTKAGLPIYKIAALVLLSVFGFALYGCGNTATSLPEAATTIPTVTVTTDATATTATQPQLAATITATSTAITTSQPQAASSATAWVPPTALVGTPIPGAQATLTAAPPLQTGVLTITNKQGEVVNMTVEIADTEASRELGLMHRAQMDPDAGMLFSWTVDVQGGFWMYNTILPLSIAFISADGTILNIQDMQPLDTNTTSPGGPYRYALETNQGFFRAHNIVAGDKVTLPGRQSVVIPGLPNCLALPAAAGP